MIELVVVDFRFRLGRPQIITVLGKHRLHAVNRGESRHSAEKTGVSCAAPSIAFLRALIAHFA